MISSIFSPVENQIGLAILYTLLALVSPRAAVFLVLPTVALTPEIQVGQVLLRPDDLMLAVLAISWGMRRLMIAVRPASPLDRPLVAYFAIGLVATLWGTAIGTADLTSLAKVSASGLHLLKRLEFVLYFFILTDTVRSTADIRRFVYLFMGSLAALSISSFGRFQETGHVALGPSGTPIHEPGLASMLNVALALGLLVASQNLGTSMVASIVLVGALWMLPFSLGRNYLVATLLMLALVAFARKRAILLVVPFLGLVLWAGSLSFPDLSLFPQHVIDRVSTLISGFTFSPGARAQGVSLADRFGPASLYSWEVLTSSPLLGWGLGSVALGSIDNEYANNLVYTGILGFAIFLWMAVRIARTAAETYRAAKRQRSPAFPLIAGLQHCLLGYALYSTFSPSISAARAGAFFFTILGLVAVLHREVVLHAGDLTASAAEAEEAQPGRPVTAEWTT